MRIHPTVLPLSSTHSYTTFLQHHRQPRAQQARKLNNGHHLHSALLGALLLPQQQQQKYITVRTHTQRHLASSRQQASKNSSRENCCSAAERTQHHNKPANMEADTLQDDEPQLVSCVYTSPVPLSCSLPPRHANNPTPRQLTRPNANTQRQRRRSWRTFGGLSTCWPCLA